jgi:hypothetical protein
VTLVTIGKDRFGSAGSGWLAGDAGMFSPLPTVGV